MYNNFIYISAIFLFASGIYIILSSNNYFRKIIGLIILQSSIIIFYIGFAKIYNGVVPIYTKNNVSYSDPLPQVLMLTAIVVGFATISVGIALIYKIREEFESIEEDEVKKEEI
jgi:multicomponent Na+:H+ antiporter subunit C